jgi:hypothetical protein
MDPTCGRGWAKLDADDRLRGRLFFHLGDDSAFTAMRERAVRKPRAPRPCFGMTFVAACATADSRAIAAPISRQQSFNLGEQRAMQQREVLGRQIALVLRAAISRSRARSRSSARRARCVPPLWS